MAIFLVLSTLALIAEYGAHAYHAHVSQWGYENNDPARWSETYPLCGGSHQSPINIDTAHTVKDSTPGPFEVAGWSERRTMRLVHGGHNVMVSLEGDLPAVWGGGLEGKYRLQQFHFHWGQQDGVGSEHTLDQRRFPMEMHMVCYKETYGSVGASLTAADGLAVLGFFFEITEDDDVAFNNITNKLVDYPNIEQHGYLNEISVDHFVPNKRLPSTFWRYQGSLTTPPCSESVVWTIFNQTIGISEFQMQRFRDFHDLTDIFRPTQPLNGRQVTLVASGGP